MEAKRFGSEPKRETVTEQSPWGIAESMGDNRVREAGERRARADERGRERAITGLVGRRAGAFGGEVGHIGGSLARRC